MPEINPESGQLLMPGPQFEPDESKKSWFARHSSKIVIAVIVGLLAVGAGYFYKSYQSRQAALKPALENILSPSAIMSPVPSPTAFSPTGKTPSAKVVSPGASAAPQLSETIAKITVPSTVPTVKKTDNEILVTAAKGNGLTHLARSALKEYLKEKTAVAGQLSAEHKIYIEDYLRKHLSHPPKVLKIGDQVAFAENSIGIAIQAAQKLNDKQLKNLHQYVLLVPSLQAP